MGFIYKITNNINQKSYIGKTERNISVRYKEHIRHKNYLEKIFNNKKIYSIFKTIKKGILIPFLFFKMII